MSRGANLSILGLYNNDPTVFDLMNYPEGFTATQQSIFKNNVLAECAEFEILYPRPSVMKNMIGIWSAKEKPYWDRVYAAAQLQYDPIENYHRTETETTTDGRTEEHSGSDTTARTGTDTNTRRGSGTDARTGTETTTHTGTETTAKQEIDTLVKTGTETTVLDDDVTEVHSGEDIQTLNSETVDENGGTDTATNSVTGFDSETLQAHDQTLTEYGKTNTQTAEGTSSQEYGQQIDTDRDSTQTITYNTQDADTIAGTDTLTHNTTDTLTLNTEATTTNNETDTLTHNTTDTMTHGETIEHTGTGSRSLEAYGNIGTMTSQDMLTQELEVAKIIQVIPIMIQSFMDRFCLTVY